MVVIIVIRQIIVVTVKIKEVANIYLIQPTINVFYAKLINVKSVIKLINVNLVSVIKITNIYRIVKNPNVFYAI